MVILIIVAIVVVVAYVIAKKYADKHLSNMTYEDDLFPDRREHI